MSPVSVGARMRRPTRLFICSQIEIACDISRFGMPKKDSCSVASGQLVVVVDGLSETAQVLKAVLEPRGMQVERVRGGGSGDRQALLSSPSVVVFDDDDPTTTRLRLKRWRGVPHVIIGSAEFAAESSTHDGHFLQKPFHYRELIQAIEQLLSDTASENRAA